MHSKVILITWGSKSKTRRWSISITDQSIFAWKPLLTKICFTSTEQQKTWIASIAPTVSWDCQWILYSGKNMTEKYRISFNWHTTYYNLDIQPIINFCLLALEWVMFEVFTGSAWLHQSCLNWNFAWYGFVVWLVHYHVKLVEIVSSFSNFNRYKQQQENQ